jgi:hypothetical protein
MRQLFSPTVAMVVVMFAASITGAAPKTNQATGTGHFTVEDATDPSNNLTGDVHVNAKGDTASAKGHFFIRLAQESTGTDISLSGRVTCLDAVGNAATVGGIVTSTNQPTTLPEGTGIIIGVLDNGSPGKDQDAITELTQTPTPVVCPPPSVVPLVVIDSGNYVVKSAP